MIALLAFDPIAVLLSLAGEFELALSPDWWRSHYDELIKVFIIDITLAGDNAIVVGMAASRVRPEIRSKVIFWGITAAVVLRILFAGVTQQMLAIVGLTLAGGFLLLWVCWKMYRQLVDGEDEAALAAAEAGAAVGAGVSFSTAVWQIIIADVSMSLDNVLAVAGAAGESKLVLIIGLGLAIILMAVASHFIARLLAKHAWIAWIGLAMILWVALDMIFRGSGEVICETWRVGCGMEFHRAVLQFLGID